MLKPDHADANTTAPTAPALPKLPPRRRRLKVTLATRKRIENAIELMINALDELNDVEAEGQIDDHPIDGDDDEPSLGAGDGVNQHQAWLCPPTDDREDENEHGGDDGKDPEREPSLGAGNAVHQERAWSLRQNPTTNDCEEQNEDGDKLDTLEVDEVELNGEADGHHGAIVDDEPSLGSLDGRMSQIRWAMPDHPGWAAEYARAMDYEFDPADPPAGHGLDEDERDVDIADTAHE